nr:hypothetical protein [Tanacetum cinerariifolium]
MLLREILHDVVGTSGYHCGVLRSFPMEELSKEMSSKILPCGDRSCRKTFKPIASLVAKGKLKQTQARSFPVFTVKDKSKRCHVVLYGELNGIPVALVARFGVVSKSKIGFSSLMVRRQKLDAVVVRDFYKKFYNSQGRVSNRCSSSIGKTRGLLSFSRGMGWEG